MKIIRIVISLLILIFVISFVLFSSAPAYATSKIKFIPSTTIPGSDFVAGDKDFYIDSSSLGEYIIAIYNYGIGLVSVLAVVMIMFGGYKWIFAAGNPTKIGDAKSTIMSALIGLFLALGSFMLLNTINPALISFKPLYTPTPKIASCPYQVNSCDSVNGFFHFVTTESAGIESALKDSMDYYNEKFKESKGVYDENRQALLQEKICKNEEAALLSCSIPGGVCLYDDGCKSIASIECGEDNSVCTAIEGFGSSFCQSLDGHCSLGVRGSKCKNKLDGTTDDCKAADLTCVDGRCFKPGVEGESCDENDECISGLVCSDDGSGIITPDKCVPGFTTGCFPENWGWDYAACEAGNYNTDKMEADCPFYMAENIYYCDCDNDKECDAGFRCVDVKSDQSGLDRDVCLPTFYR